MSFSYANPTSGPSAGGIGWFNFGNFTLNPGQTITGLTGTLNDGTTVTFDISAPANSSMIFSAFAAPVFGNFGNLAYTGIPGNVVLQNQRILNFNPATINISNIVVKDPSGNPVTNYTTILADSEETNIGESWTWTTDGGVWNQFALIGSNPPTLTGLGTQTATIAGLDQTILPGNYLLSTLAPKNLGMTLISNGGLEAVSIGFATTKVTLMKVIGERIDPADQFVLNIAGTPNSQATTAGSSTGLQTTQFAQVYALPGNTYTLSEAMAPGSGSALSAYTVLTAASNLTPAGTTPVLGPLPLSITPALGDNLVYGITNAAPQVFTKTVDKAYADVGDVLTYTVAINNPNAFTVSNVLMTDTTPVGTMYLGNLMVSAPFVGTSPAGGLTIASIGPNDTVTVSWQVQVTAPPLVNPVFNFANVTVPGGTFGQTNVVQTQVAHASVSALKSVSPMNANVGDTLTYTIVLQNTGNVAANNVVVTDAVPAGTTFVAGSVTGAAGTPPTLTLTAPIPAGGSTTITYKVKVGATVPAVNPIPNTATVVYTYTVDPAKPNGAKATNTSNKATTQVSTAALTTNKTADKTIAYVGDVITYNVSVTNTGNVAANNVILTDPVPAGTAYVPGSLTASQPFTGSPLTTIQLTSPIAPGQTVTLSYKVTVTTIPNPNPIANTMTAAFTYTVNPLAPDGVAGTSASNTANTVVLKNNYSQQISDLINSIALEEAAIGNLANAEGAKIQAVLALGATPNQMLCINKSVSDMMDALNTLESVLKQKLDAVDCQISPACMP